jgi:hypothetical protein
MSTDQKMKIAELRKRWQEAEAKADEAQLRADQAVGIAESLAIEATTLLEQYEEACDEATEEGDE